MGIKLLVVGGGGGGGGNPKGLGGGGGGGGGFRYISNHSVTETTYTVTVGTGGGSNQNGNGSSFGSISVDGGGAGGADGGDPGSNGGCGGGAGGKTNSVTVSGGTSTGYGYAGGSVPSSDVSGHGAGGGGAAGAGGVPMTPADGGGLNGAGAPCDITGSIVYYAAGGSGGYGSNYTSVGGGGVGSTGPTTTGHSATGIGSGGGGAYYTYDSRQGGAGATGTVIVAYLTKVYNCSYTGSNVETFISGDYTVVKFNASGSFIVNSYARWQTPISRWAFDGNVNDAYGLYNCTSSDTTYTTDCKQGSMAKDSGTANLPVIIYSSFSTYSISMWFRNPGSLLYQYKSGSTFPRVNLAFTPGENRMYYYIHSGAGTVIFSDYFSFTDTNNWHHIVITDTGGTVKGYLDGSLTTISGNYTPQVLDLNTSYFSSDTDDARLYDVALTADEVMNLYKSYATPIWNQPLHHWKFENDLIDSVGSSDGSNTNCTFYPNSINGNYSIYIPKTPTGYPTFPNINLADYTNFTWAFWFRSVISGVQQYLVMDWTYPGAPDERLALILQPNNRLIINPYIGGKFGYINSTTNLNIAAWNHVVLTASGTGSTYFTLYLNGKYDIAGTLPRSTYNTNTFRLGVHSPGVTAAKFDGYMDDFRFYDTALSASDVRALYNSYFTDKSTSMMPFIG